MVDGRPTLSSTMMKSVGYFRCGLGCHPCGGGMGTMGMGGFIVDDKQRDLRLARLDRRRYIVVVQYIHGYLVLVVGGQQGCPTPSGAFPHLMSPPPFFPSGNQRTRGPPLNPAPYLELSKLYVRLVEGEQGSCHRSVARRALPGGGRRVNGRAPGAGASGTNRATFCGIEERHGEVGNGYSKLEEVGW